MKLSRDQRLRLQGALLDAFRSYEALEGMVSLHLGEIPDTILGDEKLGNRALDLIEWAEERDQIARLVEAARADNPTNAALQTIAKELGGAPEGARLGGAPIPPGRLDQGRGEELEALERAWSDPGSDYNIAIVTGFSGLGKTSLIRTWLARLASRDYDGARVFYWPASRGLSDQVRSAEIGFQTLWTFCMGAEPPPADALKRGERLAARIAGSRMVLWIDDVDPYLTRQGQLRDGDLSRLLSQLALRNAGLVVLTCRSEIHSLCGMSAVLHLELRGLSPAAGRALLRACGIDGADDALEEASRSVDGHPLSLRILGGLVSRRYGGDLSRSRGLSAELARRSAAREVETIAALMQEFEPELDALERQALAFVCLFERPTSRLTLSELLDEAPDRLVGDLKAQSPSVRKAVFTALIALQLIEEEERRLQAQPLVRVWFNRRLRAGQPEVWWSAQALLYEFYLSLAPPAVEHLRDTEELYQAIAHGCRAMRHQEVFDRVYWGRLVGEVIPPSGRKPIGVSAAMRLGAVSADLEALSHLFVRRWGEPARILRPTDRGWLLGGAGFRLLSLGWLEQAREAIEAAYRMAEADDDARKAAIRARNLAQLALIAGSLNDALSWADRSVVFADALGDPAVQADALAGLGGALWLRGDTRAADVFDKVGAFGHEILLQPVGWSTTLGWWFEHLIETKPAGEASDLLEETLRETEPEGRPLRRSMFQLAAARALMRQGALREAQPHLDASIEGLERVSARHLQPAPLLERARLSVRLGALDDAPVDLERAASLAEPGQMEWHLMRHEIVSAELSLARGDRAGAAAALDGAEDHAIALRYRRLVAIVRSIRDRAGL